jgi:hypothetical protein
MPGFTVLWKPGLWVFDRSGLYDSEELDIHKELEPFAKAIVDYALKTDPELGLLKCIHQTWEVSYIVAQDMKISLQRTVSQIKAIACRGTTCYRGRRIDSAEWYVVKFTSSSDV